MESIALSEYKIPNYPRKEEVQAQPSLLRKSVYKRWQKLFDLGVSGMLAAGLSLSGCSEEAATTNPTLGRQITITQNPDSSQTRTVTPKKLAALVAPVFEHGEGRGSFGCVSVTPPAFLSEDEALVVIKEELGKYGINFDKEKVLLDNIKIAYGKEPARKNDNLKKDKLQPLEIDRMDSDKNIYIEYVSIADYFLLGGDRSDFSIQTFDFKQVAKETRKKLNRNIKHGVYCVFYDPFFSPDYKDIIDNMRNNGRDASRDMMEVVHKKGIESSKAQLRQQVQDFADWLKEKKVI